MRNIRASLAALGAACVVASPAAFAQFSNAFVFGDSLSDAGQYGARFTTNPGLTFPMYVTQQYGLPATRQTSIEFLTALAKTSSFSADEKSLLEDFLNRCDLIKFARYEATTSDSELLLEEAIRFVKGGQPCLIGSQETVR